MIRHLFVVVALFASVVVASAQQPALAVAVTTQCSAVVTVDPASRPDANSDWGVQFTLQGAPIGRVDNRAPYTRNMSGPPGLYSVGATWVRDGAPSVVLAPWTVDCRAPIVTPPVAPPTACPGTWVRGTSPHEPPPACPSIAPFVRNVVYQETFTPASTAPAGCVMPSPSTRLVTVQESCTPTAVAPQIGSFTGSATSITLGQSVTLSWSGVTGTPTPTLSMNQGIGAVTTSPVSATPTATGTVTYTLTATNSAGSTSRSWPVAVTAPLVEICGDGIDNDKDGQIDEGCTAPPSTIFGVVDPTILGDFTAAEHDAWSVDGGDGFRYRTWHPQCPTAQGAAGRCFRHEHGDNPQPFIDAQIARVKATGGNAALLAAVAVPPRFGWIGRRMPMPDEPNGHEEPHEGFKVFGALPGDRNDENRTNRIWSLSTFHMGTGGPKRFVTRLHSADIRVLHPDGQYARTQMMMDTGGTGIVCDPRQPAPNKDVIAIDFVTRCGGRKLGSQYEIWSTEGIVRAPDGREVYRSFATPALFDPITAQNPANPTEVVYIGGVTDPRVNAIKAYPENDWSGNRGCDRESYAQPGYWYNQGEPTTYYTDTLGNPVASTHPLAIAQLISAHNAIGLPATGSSSPDENTVNGAFKIHVDWCEGTQHSGNVVPRIGLAGTVNKSKLGLKN